MTAIPDNRNCAPSVGKEPVRLLAQVDVHHIERHLVDDLSVKFLLFRKDTFFSSRTRIVRSAKGQNLAFTAFFLHIM